MKFSIISKIKLFNLSRLKLIVFSAAFLFLFMGFIVSAQLWQGPILLAPTNNTTTINPVSLYWCAINDLGNATCNGEDTISPTVGYEIRICNDTLNSGCSPEFLAYIPPEDRLIYCNEINNWCIYETTLLLRNTRYNWQIVAREGATWEGSEIRLFRTPDVPPVSITLTANPTSQNITQNDYTSYMITATGHGVSVGTIVNFGQSGCPPGVPAPDAKCTLSAPSCTLLAADGVCSVDYDISNTLTVPGGNHVMVITGNAPPGLSASVIVDLDVTELADLTIVDSGTWPDSVDMDDTVTFDFTTSNIGGTDATGFTDGLFINNNEVSTIDVPIITAGTSAPEASLDWTATAFDCGTQDVYVRTDVKNDVVESNDEFNGTDNNTDTSLLGTITVICPDPDYIISDLTVNVPTSGFFCVGEDITIDMTVLNNPLAGDTIIASTAKLIDYFFLESDDICQKTTLGLDAGESEAYSCIWTPNTADTHVIEAVADSIPPPIGVIIESDEGNNTETQNIFVDDKPGLPLAPTFTNVKSDSLTVNWVDVNGEDYYQVWRIPGPGVSVSGDLLADTTSWDDSGLSPETLYTYYIVAGNNACGDSFSPTETINTPPPPIADLIIDESPLNSWPGSVMEGQTINLRFRSSNIGTADANNFIHVMEIDGIGVYETPLSGLISLAALTNSDIITVSWTAPLCDLTPHNVVLRTDTTNVVPESDEGNNTHAHPIRVDCIPKADLEIYPTGSWPDEVNEGMNVVFEYKTQNTGNVETENPFTDGLRVNEFLYRWEEDLYLDKDNHYFSSFEWEPPPPCGTTHAVYVETDVFDHVDEIEEVFLNTNPSPIHSITVNCAPPPDDDVLKGDLNCDGTVNIADLGILVSTRWWGYYDGGYGHLLGCGTEPDPPL